MVHPADLVGLKFTRWTVVKEVERSRDKVRRWLCQCECGETGIVQHYNLLRGGSKSCGCLRTELTAQRNKALAKHGHASNAAGSKPSPTYRSYRAMITRCEWDKHPAFDRYGGAGVKVCDRWRQSFEAFLEDMGERPPGTSLDRIDGSKGYEAGNCKWSTRSEQNKNRKPMSEWKRRPKDKAA